MADWIKISMKFTGKCMDCGKAIPAGQPGMWSRGVGVKHVQCADGSGGDAGAGSDGIGSVPAQPARRIACAICGKPAGCAECEFQESCDIPNVSPACLCRDCSQKDGVVGLYAGAVGRRFAVLSDSAAGRAAESGLQF